MRILAVCSALLALASCRQKQADFAAATEGEPAPAVSTPATSTGAGTGSIGYLKGSTHVHTSTGSGDASAPVDQVVGWYESRGYDFIVVTDHNRVTTHDHDGELLVIPGVELTNNPGRCTEPRPEPGAKCRVHVNALFVTETPEGELDWKERASTARIDKYARALETTESLGGIAQINHPTWYWGMTPELLAELGRRGAPLVEIANSQFAPWNRGDSRHMGVEQLWDEVLTAGVTVWGVASDDAHHYRGYGKYPAGGGWVMVRAERTAHSVRAALERGDFYSSTGVTFERVEVTGGALAIEVAGEGPHTIRFIGTGGEVLAEVSAAEARYTLADAPPGYVRAVVANARGRQAWTQPVPVP